MARPKKNEEKNRPARVSFRIAKDVDEGLRELANTRGADLSDVVHDLLERALKRELAKSRERHGIKSDE
jgi:hypothetical protein